ncbi:MAG: hypothetical protein KC609_08865 [Myxococcales bacterium]|nr:hypothetical protein [Myxococcales bacterium]
MKSHTPDAHGLSHQWLVSTWTVLRGRLSGLFAEFPEALPVVFRALRSVHRARTTSGPTVRRFDFERRYLRQLLIGDGDEALYRGASFGVAQAPTSLEYGATRGILFPASVPNANYLGVSQFVAEALSRHQAAGSSADGGPATEGRRSGPFERGRLGEALWLMPRNLVQRHSGLSSWSSAPLARVDVGPLRVGEAAQRRASSLFAAIDGLLLPLLDRADAAAMMRYLHRAACLEIVCRCARLRSLIEGLGVAEVFVPNEQIEPMAIAVAAAQRAGVSSRQHLHGLESELYVPFLVRETWVWDPRSFARMAGFGASSERLAIVGNLEVGYWGRWFLTVTERGAGRDGDRRSPHTALDASVRRDRSAPSMRSSRPSGRGARRCCLFLAQFHGGAGSANPFLRGFELLVRSIAVAGGWRLRLRQHPFSPADPLVDAALRDAASAIEVEIAPSSEPLAPQILESDCVLTVSSSGIAIAHAFGRTTGLLWLPEIEALFGPPLVSVDHVLRCDADVTHLLHHVPERREVDRDRVAAWVADLESRVIDRLADHPTRR